MSVNVIATTKSIHFLHIVSLKIFLPQPCNIFTQNWNVAVNTWYGQVNDFPETLIASYETKDLGDNLKKFNDFAQVRIILNYVDDLSTYRGKLIVVVVVKV